MIQKYLLAGFGKIKIVSNHRNFLIRELLLFAIFIFSFLFAGCQSTLEPMPYINPAYTSNINLPPEVDPWEITHPIEPSSDVPKSWYPPKGVEKNWTAIIIHHSATENGNAAIFHKSHIEEHNWDGIGYDFVIGNGTDSGDGQVEVTYRWTEQKTGAHCWTPDNWANEDGIGICLVGNFNITRPTRNQMQALVKLTDFLQKKYKISQNRITGHGETRGAHATDCPGKLFPMGQFKSSLNF